MGISTVVRSDILYMVQSYVVQRSCGGPVLKVTEIEAFICPTRWTMRVDAIQNVVSQYECVLDSLEVFVEPSRGVSAE
jgi:hypothetical protein